MYKILLLPLVLLFNISLVAQTPLFYSNKISEDSLRKTVYILASDSLEGRETGKRGQKRAASFLEKKYHSIGLIPLGDSLSGRQRAYTQDHTISLKNNKSKNLSVNGESFLYGKDFFYSDSGTDTTLSFSNFIFFGKEKKLDIKTLIQSKKINSSNLLILNKDGNTDSLAKELSDKEINISTSFIVCKEETIKKYFVNHSFAKINTGPRLFFISESVAARIFTQKKYNKIIAKLSGRKKAFISKVESQITVDIVSEDNSLRGQNVVALLRGKTNEETVIISSHYDHLGIRDSAIYYGADDNGSGTSAVLELARIFFEAAKDGNTPKRNILFLNVSGEEKGLLGSSWFVSEPPVPIGSIVADLNIDMIGRTDPVHDSIGNKDYVYIIGSDKMSTELHTINEEQNKTGPNLELNYKFNSTDDPNQYYRRSDHYNFVKKGIPVIFYFDGNHADYHKPTDTAEKIDFKILSERAKLVFMTAWELANREDRIVVDKKETPPNRNSNLGK